MSIEYRAQSLGFVHPVGEHMLRGLIDFVWQIEA